MKSTFDEAKTNKNKSKGEKRSGKVKDATKEKDIVKDVDGGNILLNSGKNWTTVTKRGEVPANKVLAYRYDSYVPL